MSCDEFLQNISDYVEGHLSDTQNKIFNAHLAQCPVCTQIVTDVQFICHSLRKLPKKTASSTFMTQLHQRLANEATDKQLQSIDQLFSTLRIIPFKPVWSLVAAAAAIAIIAWGINIYFISNKESKELLLSPRLTIPPLPGSQHSAQIPQLPLYQLQAGMLTEHDSLTNKNENFINENLSQSLRNHFLQVKEQKH